MNQKINPPQSLQGSLQLPADKSISHRSALFAALHEGTSTISNFSEAADPHSTLKCLRGLGVKIHEQGDEADTIKVEGVGRDGLTTPVRDLDCGNSGTTMRLLSGIIAGSGIPARLTGDESLSVRTMKRIIDPLTEMGAQIKAQDGDFAPLEISRNDTLNPISFPLPIASAQLKSCVLLAGLFGDEPTEVIETLSSRDHTERLLNLPVSRKNHQKVITSSRKSKIPRQSYRVPNDFSAAAFWLVAGAIHPNAEIELKNVGINPTRTGAMEILQKMGAKIKIKNKRFEGAEPVADLSISTSALKAVGITEEVVPNCIDEIPIITIAMLFADGVSRISGAGELRHKETDRLSAIADILQKAGAEFTEFEDGLEIKGDPGFTPKAAVFESFHDHRIAMSAAVLSLLAEAPSQIADAECTAISYPGFWGDLLFLGS
ncbi:MAG TPA: 3-phosphoshikimate 1-carboxyvinyltransferase [Balneolaceae bacterium]|nr:3-phosphoshikimate 1-carboxyvinyltransferase [Balneolaceae bacterium]